MARSSIFIFILTSSIYAGGQNFSREQVVDDLAYLRSSLEEAHYDLYAYTPRTEFDINYQNVREKVGKDSLDLLKATTLLQQVISKASNGHTEIPFPGKSYIDYAYSGGTLFPLELAFEGGKNLIRKNWSDNDMIAIDSELVSINGLPIEDILEKLRPQVSAERPYFQNVKMEFYSFPRLYWQVYGQQDAFEVEIKIDNQIKRYSIEAVDVFEGYEMKRNGEILNAQMKLQFINGSAYLNPGSFGGDETKYQTFIDSAFVAIRAAGSKTLILDLKNNSGGDDSFSDYLVSYIADEPFAWNSRFTLKTSQFLKDHVRQKYDTTSAFWKSALTHENGEIYDYAFDFYQPQPKEKRFLGQVYILVNRQSHSQAAVTAAQIQDYGFGTLVGEETGDYPSLYASQFQFNLPETGIEVKVSKGRIVRVNGSTKSEGVIPDIQVKDHLLDDKDEILEYLLSLIGQ